MSWFSRNVVCHEIHNDDLWWLRPPMPKYLPQLPGLPYVRELTPLVRRRVRHEG